MGSSATLGTNALDTRAERQAMPLTLAYGLHENLTTGIILPPFPNPAPSLYWALACGMAGLRRHH